METSLEVLRDAVYGAFYALLGLSWDDDGGEDGEHVDAGVPVAYPVETYSNTIIARIGPKHYRVAYTMSEDGEVSFADRADWVEVTERRDWVEAVPDEVESEPEPQAELSDNTPDSKMHSGYVEVLPVEAQPEQVTTCNTLKAIAESDDELRVGNYIVLYGGRDLEGIGSSRRNEDGTVGEYFTAATELDSDYTKSGYLHVDWEHGTDPDGAGVGKDDILGYVDWKTARSDATGLFVERVLNRRNRYMQWLEDLIKQGLVGNSTEAVSAQVEKKSDGEITRWPLRRDTLTVTPMEPRMLTANALAAFKGLGLLEQYEAVEAQPEAGNEPAACDPSCEREATPKLPVESDISDTEEKSEMETQEVQLMIENAVKAAIEAYRQSQPVVDNGGHVLVTHDPADNIFTSIAEQCKAVQDWEVSKGRTADPRLSRLAAKASGASEGTPDAGGYLLEPTLAAEILLPMHQEGPFSSAVSRLPVSNNSNYGWINGVDETSRATGSRWGGIRGYRLAEGATITGSKPKFRRINWELHKFAVLCYATDELLADAAMFSTVIRMGAGEELSFMVNDDILNGDGNAGPLGILSSGALIQVAKESGQAADTIVNENLVKMWSRLDPRSKMNAVWYYGTDSGPQLHTIAEAVGTAGFAPRFVRHGEDGSLRIFGKPAIETEFNATVGDLGDIVLANMGEYLFWDKGAPQEASSIHVQFLTDETVFRFIYRVDGTPSVAAPLTPYKGSNTVSPFVALAARA